MFKRFLLIMLVIFACCPRSAEASTRTTRILFIGNSITYRNKKGEENYAIAYFKGLAKASGKKVVCDRVTKNGSNLSLWTSNAKYKKKLVKKLKSNQYDYVVIQENTDYALKKNSTSTKSVKSLVSLINKYQKSYKKVFNASWNYKYGKFGISYSKGQSTINSYYKSLGSKYKCKVAYTGKAFKYAREHYDYQLWVKDNNHPTYIGSYLSACCLYGAIFGEDSYGINYNPRFSNSIIKRMQKSADRYN